MEKDDVGTEFPQMKNMFEGNTKQRLDLLRSYLQSNENAKACETQIKLKKTWTNEFEGKEELLTVREMRARGVSEQFVANKQRLMYFSLICVFC